MAELAVGATLNLLGIVFHLNKLNPRKHVEKEIVGMESWLKSIKEFIEKNDGRECSRKQLVSDIRGTAYDIEDVLDEILLHTPLYRFHNHRITRKVHNMAHSVYHGFPVCGISDKIEDIKRRIDVIESQRKLFSSSSSEPRPLSGSPSKVALRVSPHLLDDKMVGYEKPQKEFSRMLLDAEHSLVRLAVEGPHGSGKTTFVENVYRKEEIWREFDCRAWFHVSRCFDIEEFCIDMLKQLGGSRLQPYPDDESLNALSKLRKYLTGKRFLVVLDDIWKKEEWDKIKDAFPDSFCGSRIIFTTSFADVATKCALSRHHICSLKDGLEPFDAWSLFRRKAFPGSNGECPLELKDISQQILKRCDSVPLAIVAVSDALAHIQRRPNAWKSFHDSFGCPLGSNSALSGISNVLLPTYMDLSSNLKSCFLYLSIFPENYAVKRGRLIRLWVAEGFVNKTECMTAEEVAEDYFYKLIHKNLVHVCNWDFERRPRNCRVLNLFLPFITQKCKYENFASVYSREITNESERIRRLSFHEKITHLPQNGNLSGARSMFLLRSLDISPSEFEKNLCGFKLLRVLDLQDAHLTEFPNTIIHLALLRYLSLRATKINTIPSSIKKLSYLETLDLKQTNITELPNGISHLHNLRHLFAYKHDQKNVIVFNSVQGVKISEGLSNLTNLQNLSLVRVDQKGRVLTELQKLSHLRKLRLMELKGEHGKDLCACIEQMEKLKTLDICSITKEEYLELGEMENSNPPRTLERLYLKGRLKEIPGKISSLHNLLRIGLNWSKLEKSPLEALKWLPNLMELQLVDSYVGEELIFEASGFEMLKILLIEDFSELHKVEIEIGAIPKLEKISLCRCPKLKTLPLGIRNLAKIKEMIIYGMSEEFITRVRKNRKDRVYENIPVVHFLQD